jgi:hypothetical protein
MTTSPVRTRGWRTFAAGMVLYAVGVVAAGFFLNAADPGVGLRVVLALAPAAAFLWGMSGWLRAVRGFDELGRRIHAEAATVTLAVLLALAVTYGLLQAYVGVPSPHAFVVFGLGGATYALAAVVAQRRYA